MKVELFKRDRRLKKKKTSTRFNTVNPVFNDMLGFDLCRSDLSGCRLRISVVQRIRSDPAVPEILLGSPETQLVTDSQPGKDDGADIVSSKTEYHVFGVVSLGGRGCSQSESDHFQQMLKSPRVPIAKWHLLCATTF